MGIRERRNWEREAVGGAHVVAAAVLYSIMASAKANQVEPFAYVRRSTESVVRLLAARGCDAASGRLVGGAPGISPVLVAVAGRTGCCDTEKLIFDGYSGFCLKT